MFGLETFVTVAVLVVILFAGSVFERNLASTTNPRPGLALPILSGLVALLLSIQNFLIAFQVSFSPAAFAAAVVIFTFYMIPSIFFTLIYFEERRRMERQQKERQRRNRAAQRQQVYRKDSGLEQRYRRSSSTTPIRPIDRSKGDRQRPRRHKEFR